MSVKKGETVKCTVTGIVKFGVFVTTEGGDKGLVHISEIRDGFVDDISRYLAVGDTVNAQVISVDERGRVGLSIKKARALPVGTGSPEEFFVDRSDGDFEDMMTRYKSANGDKLSELKRKNEGKKRR